jgi:ribosomal protein L3 glutamine methyltransferase
VEKVVIMLDFIKKCDNGQATLEDLILLGSKLMKKAKLHHHFFRDRTFYTTAQVLAYHALGITSHSKKDLISSSQALSVIALFDKRIAERLPVEYIIHEAEYLERSFYVNEDVLIPRSLMNTRFQDFLNDVHWTNHRVLDLCTGSGCIGITLALMDPQLKVDLSDVSEKALAVAKINVDRFHLQDRVHCILSDGFSQISDQYDLIITNPPYVTTKDYENAPMEFKNEPKLALEAGKDGLSIIDTILKEAPNYLTANGLFIAEVGSPAVKAIKKKYPHLTAQWLKYRNPQGKVSIFADASILICTRKDLLKTG